MKIRRDDTFQGSDRPFIAVTTDHFAFNAMFVRIAELSPDKRVTAYADPENLKLGFEFHTEEKPDSFALSSQSSDKRGMKRTSMQCAARGVVMKFPWIKSVTKLPVKDRRFEPKKEGHLWVIQLCPAFEERKARESADIPSDATGIYRYVRDDGEIVYIGRGNIKNRLASPEREDWEFAVIEYSILENPDQQLKWEDYWLTRYQEEHGGKLPIYNKILGTSTVKK
jgi:hypothetical protein